MHKKDISNKWYIQAWNNFQRKIILDNILVGNCLCDIVAVNLTLQAGFPYVMPRATGWWKEEPRPLGESWHLGRKTDHWRDGVWESACSRVHLVTHTPIPDLQYVALLLPNWLRCPSDKRRLRLALGLPCVRAAQDPCSFFRQARARRETESSHHRISRGHQFYCVQSYVLLKREFKKCFFFGRAVRCTCTEVSPINYMVFRK